MGPLRLRMLKWLPDTVLGWEIAQLGSEYRTPCGLLPLVWYQHCSLGYIVAGVIQLFSILFY